MSWLFRTGRRHTVVRLRRVVVLLAASAVAPLASRLGLAWRQRAMARRARVLALPVDSASFLSFEQWLPRSGREYVQTLRRRDGARGPIVLGRIDNDGRVLSFCGDLPGFERVDQATFVKRYRYDLDLVLVGNAVLIRKDYRGDRKAFLREWLSLATLGETCCSPVIHHVDEKHLRLFKSFVPGSTLRQRLVESGARILSIETDRDPELDGLSPLERIEAVWARGRGHFGEALGPSLVDSLEDRLEAIHGRCVTGFSLSFGNVVLHEESGEPWFIDFDAARVLRRTQSRAFKRCRERDRHLFTRIYRGVARP